jgi:hypothetical protein
MGDLGRKPQTLVEFDIPYCTRVYGASPCNAVLGTTGPAKCFNSLATCQFRSAYVAGVKTITFTHNNDGIPDAPGVYPALKSVSTRAGELNLSGIDPKSTALGTRARVTATLQDFQDSDTWLDLYQAERVSGAALASGVGYQPLDRGQFIKRMFARFPYYLGWPLRVRRGYVGDAPASMPTETYVVSELKGPDAGGSVTITAMDVIDLTDGEKATEPKQSTGKLLNAILASDTTATLTPELVGDAEYPASGIVRIGRELISFTRAGDVLTMVRGQEGTAASGFSALDAVQICTVFEPQAIYEAIYQILTSQDTVPASQITLADWEAENSNWYSGVNIRRTVVTRPVAKKTLIGELCQLGVLVWGDPVLNQIQYRINAPLGPGETFYQITDDNSLIEGGVGVDRAEDQRISTLVIYHGIRDWTDEISPQNFNKATAVTVSENPYDQEALFEIYLRWFGREGDDATASVIAERLVSRYESIPKIVTGIADAKDRAGLHLGARIEVTSYVLQGNDGALETEPMQVRYVEYTEDRVKFTAETYRLDGRFGFWMDETTDEMDYDLATAAERQAGAYWWDQDEPDFLTAAYVYY